MATLSAILRTYGPQGMMFFCPGCENPHGITVNSTGRPNWTYNGNPEKPTFTPSILSTYDGKDADTRDDDGDRSPARICHSYVTDGRIQFLDDCTHELKGQTVDLPPLPDWLRDESDT